MSAGAADLQRRDTTISAGAVALLVLLHFLLHPWLGALAVAPDLLIGALLLAALRVPAGTAALLGFLAGPLEAAMLLDDPGAYALVLGLTGYLAARSREILFADASMFVMIYLFVGTWLARVALILFPGDASLEGMAVAGLDALATAVVCGLVAAFTSSLVRRA